MKHQLYSAKSTATPCKNNNIQFSFIWKSSSSSQNLKFSEFKSEAMTSASSFRIPSSSSGKAIDNNFFTLIYIMIQGGFITLKHTQAFSLGSPQSMVKSVPYPRASFHPIPQVMLIQIDVILQFYNKFKEVHKMSLFGGLANDMGMGSLMAKSYLTLKVLEQQNILKVLAVALNRSFSVFQTGYVRATYAAIARTPQKLEERGSQKDQSCTVIEILSDSQEVPDRKQQNLKSEKQRRATIQALPVRETAKEHRINEQIPTSDETNQEEVARKAKQAKKLKETREISFHVPVPEVDENETCYLPKFGMPQKELTEKRLNLLKRRVKFWGSPIKKQKREIRMLH